MRGEGRVELSGGTGGVGGRGRGVTMKALPSAQVNTLPDTGKGTALTVAKEYFMYST